MTEPDVQHVGRSAKCSPSVTNTTFLPAGVGGDCGMPPNVGTGRPASIEELHRERPRRPDRDGDTRSW